MNILVLLAPKVYELLQKQGIDVPFHVILNRDGSEGEVNVVEEFDEYIVVNGITVNKPLVEKPVDAEDHNIYVSHLYYKYPCNSCYIIPTSYISIMCVFYTYI